MSTRQKESGNIIRWIKIIHGSEICFRMHGMPFYMYKEGISDSIAVHIFEERQKTMLFSGKGNLPYPVVKKLFIIRTMFHLTNPFG